MTLAVCLASGLGKLRGSQAELAELAVLVVVVLVVVGLGHRPCPCFRNAIGGRIRVSATLSVTGEALEVVSKGVHDGQTHDG